MNKIELSAYFRQLGKKGGKARSQAKTDACRANAKLPRKTKSKPSPQA